MRFRIGLAVGAHEIRVVFLSRGAVTWSSTEPFGGVDSLSSALSKLFEHAPPLPRRARVYVAVSPAWVQAKPLEGLPSVKPARIANQLLRENQQAFFLWTGSANYVTDIHVGPGGARWAAAFNKTVLDDVTSFVRAKRLVLARVTPAVVALVAFIPNRDLVWTDGEDTFTLEGDTRGPRRIERGTQPDDAGFALPHALTSLGADGMRFLDSYAAIETSARTPLSWEPPRDAARARLVTRTQQLASISALIAVATFAAFGPGLRAAKFARTSETVLASARQTQVDLARESAELRRVTQLLNRIESFRAERGRVTRVLAALSRAIPESTAMLSFRVDSAEGSFTAIAPHVADVLPELSSVDMIAAPRIVGAVTREVIGGIRLERAVFRFRWSRVLPATPRTVPSAQGAP